MAWKDERFDEVICLADAARSYGKGPSFLIPGIGFLLWPLISVRLHMGQVPKQLRPAASCSSRLSSVCLMSSSRLSSRRSRLGPTQTLHCQRGTSPKPSSWLAVSGIASRHLVWKAPRLSTGRGCSQ